MTRVKLVGATGYGGVGLVELVLRHPDLELVALVAASDTGAPLSHFWPHLVGHCDMMVYTDDASEANVEADVVVFSTPDRVGQSKAEQALSSGMRVLDYSGDFRFKTSALYSEYAGRIGLPQDHLAEDLLKDSVYGLPELHKAQIPSAAVVGNPGCFAVSAILGLAPAVAQGLVELEGIVCDCKTGISGAGKKPKPGFHYPEAFDSMGAYRLSGHQHVMEIEQELGQLAGQDLQVTFTPQVVPMCRGILSTLYGRLPGSVTGDDVFKIYSEYYAESPFVRVCDGSMACRTGDITGSNRVLLQVACDERTGTFRVISHIDNLMKGQAANAVQNLNIMFGMEETLGLDFPGLHP